MTTYSTDHRLTHKSSHVLGSQFFDLRFQLVLQPCDVIGGRLSRFNPTIGVAWRNMMCVAWQDRLVQLSSYLMAAKIKSTEGGSVIRSISRDEKLSSWLWVRLLFGVVL